MTDVLGPSYGRGDRADQPPTAVQPMDPARAPPDRNLRSLDCALAPNNPSDLTRDGSAMSPQGAKFARHVSCNVSGIHANFVQ
jgi:hypothetical protein